jgi:hypothetical protein
MLAVLSFMFGFSLLLPWQALLKSLPYILQKLPAAETESRLLALAPTLLALTFTLSNFGALAAATLTDADSFVFTRWFGLASVGEVISARLYVGLVGSMLLFLAAIAFPACDIAAASIAQSRLYLLLFVLVFMLAGVFVCFLQRSVYPLLAYMPSKTRYIPLMLMGQASAGLLSSSGSFLLVSPEEGVVGAAAVMAVIYFVAAILSLTVTLGVYHGHVCRSAAKAKAKAENTKTPLTQQCTGASGSIAALRSTLHRITPWPQLVALNFAVTLSIFPGMLASSARTLSGSLYFLPWTFLCFDVFDLAGKALLSKLFPLPRLKSRIGQVVAWSRLWFVPLFWALPNFRDAVAESGSGSRSGWADGPYFGLLAVMAASSGWVNAVCLISASAASEASGAADLDPSESDRVGTLMGLSIALGLVSGSGCSFILQSLLRAGK